MMSRKTPHAAASRGEPVRQRILDAAEGLLRRGQRDFSMRELAAEAGVSFATPFNHFGNKAALMHALSDRRIDAMVERLSVASRPADPIERLLQAVDIAVSVMTEESAVSRAVMGWIGTPGPAPSQAMKRSAELWSMALTRGDDPDPAADKSVPGLSDQLALGFRGALSFWTAGELSDEALRIAARSMARALLLSPGISPDADAAS